MNTESTTPQAATTAHRYAVYFAPSPGTLGWLAGSHWLGRCAAQLRPLPQLNIHGVAPADLQRLTAAPRRHGWHATLKAPFALAPGTDWLTLHHAVQQVARSLTPFTMPPMQVQRIDDFLALVPMPSHPANAAINAAAAACVTQLQPLAARPSGDELAQRRAAEEFRFHMPLTGPLSLVDENTQALVLDAQGNVLNTSRQFPAPSYNLSDRDYFIAQRDNPVQGVYLSSTVRSKSTGQWMFFISHRLTGSDGEFIGVVILGLSPSFYANFYEKFGADESISISLLRNDFTYLARWPERADIMGQKNLSGSTYELIHKQNKQAGVIITSHPRLAEGGKMKTRMAAIQSLEKYPLIINFSIDEELYLAEWRKIGTGIAIIAIFSVLAVITAFSLLVSLLERREQDLITTTELKQQAEVINRDQAILLHNLTQQQSALKDFSDQLQAIFQNAADGIIMIDERGIIEAVNPAASSIYGYQERDVVGRSCKILSLADQADFSELALNNPEFIRTGKLRLETESLRKDGQIFAVELAISEYKLTGKRKLVLILRDISERRKVERMKSEFISTVSHELRTPLTAIRGALGLVVGGAMGSVSEKLSPLLTMAHKNSESLTRLINDLLDIQKIEAGKLEFVYEVCNLSNLLRKLFDGSCFSSFWIYKSFIVLF